MTKKRSKTLNHRAAAMEGTALLVILVLALAHPGVPSVQVPVCGSKGIFHLDQVVHKREDKEIILDISGWNLSEMDTGMTNVLKLAREKVEEETLEEPLQLLDYNEGDTTVETLTPFTVMGLSEFEDVPLALVKAQGKDLWKECKDIFEAEIRGSPGDIISPSDPEFLRQTKELYLFLGLDTAIIAGERENSTIRSIGGEFPYSRRKRNADASANNDPDEGFVLFSVNIALNELNDIQADAEYSVICIGQKKTVLMSEAKKTVLVHRVHVMERNMARFKKDIQTVQDLFNELPQASEVPTGVQMSLQTTASMDILTWLTRSYAGDSMWMHTTTKDLEKLEEINRSISRVRSSISVRHGAIWFPQQAIALKETVMGSLTNSADPLLYDIPSVSFRPLKIVGNDTLIGTLSEPSYGPDSEVRVYNIEPFVLSHEKLSSRHLTVIEGEAYASEDPLYFENCVGDSDSRICDVTLPRSASILCGNDIILNFDFEARLCDVTESNEIQVFPSKDCGLDPHAALVLSSNPIVVTRRCNGLEDKTFFLEDGRGALPDSINCRLIADHRIIWEGQSSQVEDYKVIELSDRERRSLQALFPILEGQDSQGEGAFQEALNNPFFLATFTFFLMSTLACLACISCIAMRRCCCKGEQSGWNGTCCCLCQQGRDREAWPTGRIVFKRRTATSQRTAGNRRQARSDAREMGEVEAAL